MLWLHNFSALLAHQACVDAPQATAARWADVGKSGRLWKTCTMVPRSWARMPNGDSYDPQKILRRNLGSYELLPSLLFRSRIPFKILLPLLPILPHPTPYRITILFMTPLTAHFPKDITPDHTLTEHSGGPVFYQMKPIISDKVRNRGMMR